MLGLEKDLVIDRKNGTIRRFGPDDGPDGVELPLGVANTPELAKLLSNIKQYQITSLRSGSLEEVAIHETVHRIDTVLSADAFFRNKSRLEADIRKITAEIDAIRGGTDRKIPSEAVPLLVRRRQMTSELRSLERQRKKGSYAAAKDSPIRLASQQWIDENTPWLEAYAEELELAPTFSDQAYLLSILGYDPNWDFIAQRFGYKRDSKIMPSKIRDRITTTDRVETLAEVISSQVLGDRRIPAGTSGTDSHLPEMLDNYAKQIIPEELKFILSDPNWRDDQLPPLTALAGRQELDIASATPESLLDREPRGSLLPRVAGDPSATSQMLSDAASEDRYHRILGELAQAEIDEPELFRDGVLVDSVRSPFSPPPHLAGSGLRDELAEATSWREVSQLLKGKRVVVFDTETAGRMDPDEVDEDRIVQLGGVVYVDGVIVDRFSMYVNVDYDELSDWSQENLIDAEGKPMSPEFLAKQPDMPTVLQEFMRFANGDSDGSDVVFMAHNAAFDLKRMELERQRHDPDGVPSFDLDEVTYFDTMGLGNIAKRAGVEDGPGSASLKKLQEFFGLEDFSWHTADADSEMTGQVLWRLLDYMDENDVPLDGLDPVAGLERQREEFAEYDGKVAEFLRQKERLAELRGLSDQLRSDRDDAVSSMIVMGAEGLDGGEEIPVRAGFYDDPDGYVPDPVTRDDIARQLGFADAEALDAATVDDPVMENNARILEELASYGFRLDAMEASSEDAQAVYEANWKGSKLWAAQSSPVDDAKLEQILDRIAERSKTLRIRQENAGVGVEVDKLKAFEERLASTSPEEARQSIVNYMRNIFDDPDTTIAVASKNVPEILASGRYISIQESGAVGSGGAEDARPETEAILFGLHQDVPGPLRNAYGFVVTGEQRRAARRKIFDRNAPIVYQTVEDGKLVNFLTGVDDDKKDEIINTLMPEVLDELFPGVQKISDLPNDADIETAIAALNDKIFERMGVDVFNEEFQRRVIVADELRELNIASYGSGVMMLDPKVMLRSSLTDGDSLNHGGKGVPYSLDLTDQQLLDMVVRTEKGGPVGEKEGEAIVEAALMGYDSTVLNQSNAVQQLRQQGEGLGNQHSYIEAQIFGNFTTAEIITATDGYKNSDISIPAVVTDLTPESEVAAIKAQRAADRADQSIEAVSADAASTIDDVDRAVSADPNFGLPPGPDSPTEWDRERLATADVIDRYDSPPTSISALDGEGLREDQKSLNRMVAEATTEEDLVPLREALRKAVEDEGSPLYQQAELGVFSDEKTFKVIEALDDLIAIKAELGDAREEQQQRIRQAEEELALRLRAAIGHHWGDARSEVFHWDFLSERVQTVLGDEFGVSIQHERREPPSDFESIRNLQEALAPFVDAWARSQYSATQQYFKDNDIREVNLYRGLFIPKARSSEGPRGTMTDRSVPTARGLQSWTSRLETALLFLGNQYETAKDEIKKIRDSGEDLGMPEHVLLHDLVPVELIFGFSVYNHAPSFSFGVSAEQEVVVLGGSSRRVNMLGDDFLDLHREPSGSWTRDRRESTFRLVEDQVFDYLSSDAPNDLDIDR